MLPETYSPYHDDLFTDLPAPPNPWIELYQLAERAGVSVEHLCAAVQIASLHQKAAPSAYSPPEETDLDTVVRVLAGDGSIEVKQWEEDLHPRDDKGRFTTGAHHVVREAGPAESSPILPNVDHAQALQELHGVHNALGQIFQGLRPRWRGKLQIEPKVKLGSAGTKSWSCLISIAQEQFAIPARKFCSMVHESLHSYSPTTFGEMKRAPNWEEGVIENAVRIHRTALANQVGAVISEQEFRDRDKVHPYRFFARAIERMRVALGDEDKEAFYDLLMRTPADKIEAHILSQAAHLTPEQKAKFDRVYMFEKKILDGEWDPKKGWYSSQWLRTHPKETKAMTREEVLYAILYARGREAVAQAQKMRDEWVKLHPDDDEIFEASESLEMMAEGYALFPDEED